MSTSPRRTRVAALALATCLAGLPAAADTLRIGLNSDPDALDPDTSRTVAARSVFMALCDKLIDIDADLNFVPQLATGWTWSDDLLALTLELRDDVVFHDGESFDAAAVAFNIERSLTHPRSTRRSEISAVERAVVVDTHQVRLELSQPFVPLIAALADRAGMMVSPQAVEAAGDDFALAPACAGPYRFVERVQLDRIVVERFPDHWDADAYAIERIVFQPVPDSTVRVANLRSGDLDLIEQVAPTDMAVLEGLPGIRLEAITGLGSHYVQFNVGAPEGSEWRTPMIEDARLREAFELAIDRPALNQVTNEGLFTPGNQPVPPTSPFYVAELPPPGRDVERARALLREAGHERLAMRMITPTTTAYQRTAEILQAMLAEAEIDLQLVGMEVVTALDHESRGDFEALLIRWSGRADPDGNIASFLTCAGSLNGGSYCNPAVDEAIAAARATADVEARYAAYREAADHYLAERPFVYLFHEHYLFALRDRVQGFVPVPDGLVRFRGMSLDG